MDDRRAAFVVEGKTEDFGDAPAGETIYLFHRFSAAFTLSAICLKSIRKQKYHLK